MKKLILLALCASVAAICQNPPVALPPQLSVSSGAPAGSFSIDSSGNASFKVPTAQGSGVTVQNADGSIFIGDNSSSASNFAPVLLGSASSAQPGLEVFGQIPSSSDSGTSAVILIRGFTALNAPTTTRPVLQIQNFSTTDLQINADGSAVIPQLKSTTGTRYVCVDTAGKLISSATACSGT